MGTERVGERVEKSSARVVLARFVAGVAEQVAAGGVGLQRGVGHRAPQIVGQARGQRVIIGPPVLQPVRRARLLMPA